jgi:bifunctional non-homologous end joining protein LigD
MSDRLGEYRRKRRVGATPEPEGAGAPGAEASLDRFVIQQHSATRLHWDLRLEREGVLVSWALPSGLPLDPEKNAMAVHTEDHPLEYIDFHGEIPEGNYGAGTMTIWDSGTYETEKFEAGKVIVTLHGERAQGRYALFRAGKEERDWMIHRMDPAPEWLEPMPEDVGPMLAVQGPLPADEENWAYELCWRGERILAFVTPGKVRLTTAAGADITSKFPEVRPITRALGSVSAVLDGVLVSFDGEGRPAAEVVATRMSLDSESAIRRRAKSDPVTFQIFDALYLDGRLQLEVPYSSRREALEELNLHGSAWTVPGAHRGDGEELLARVGDVGLDAVIAKRLDSHYRSGEAGDAWVRIDAAP